MVKTWKVEMFVVAAILAAAVIATGGAFAERLGALAVLLTFGHAQVAERMREREALKSKPDVHCHAWSLRYFVAKEMLWLAYFVMHQSWSALVGVGVFLLYPLWRKWWRARHPLLKVFVRQPVTALFLNARMFDALPESNLDEGDRWLATVVLRLDRQGCEFIAAISRAQSAVSAFVKTRTDLTGGEARLRSLQFYDAPAGGDRFARLVLVGEGAIERV